MNHEFKTIHLEREGPTACVTLARPEMHDAFDEIMVEELAEAFRDLGEDDSARLVLVRSKGKSFCAGADLNWMRRMADQSETENHQDAALLEEMFRTIAWCPKPVVARVQGAAFGGGAGLVAACDVAIASSEAKLAFTEVRLGILPAVISPYVLRKMPAGPAQALFLTGEIVSAQRAVELGLFHRVVPPMDLDGAVDAVIQNLLAGSPVAQAAVKRLIREVESKSFEDAAISTTEAIAAARSSDDGREGMTAFLEKRKPKWAPGGRHAP
jgi:methylglutaconyl-CoA hydratase